MSFFVMRSLFRIVIYLSIVPLTFFNIFYTTKTERKKKMEKYIYMNRDNGYIYFIM